MSLEDLESRLIGACLSSNLIDADDDQRWPPWGTVVTMKSLIAAYTSGVLRSGDQMTISCRFAQVGSNSTVAKTAI
jgi:hypothetical protein